MSGIGYRTAVAMKTLFGSSASVLLLYFLSLIGYGLGHVGLYYPPARTYALDFLDSARTVPPCGMAPGAGPVTDLEAASTFTVSWYLGYAHAGGYRIELLTYDAFGKVNRTYNLTSAQEQYIGNVTTTSQTVTLPSEVTQCVNCTIRLVRQALNWGPSYLFWSCADVNIVPASNYTPSCGRGGTYDSQSQKCVCSNTFSGLNCQFQDECRIDADCGTHGVCKQVTPYSYPQKQCYCLPGWMGIKCNKASSLSSVQYNISQYTNVTLSETSAVKLFYRIVKETNELEVVLTGRTVSYLGLGWKSINSPCTPYSLRYNSQSSQSPSAEPEPEPEPEPAPEPKAEPTARSGNSVSSTPAPEPEPESVPEPEVTGSADVNGMDCADIVIGAAIGNLSRIGDYYTADRSTPRMDEFYGGSQSLTAAVGMETGEGITTIMFRRPLTATESTDNTIVNDLMTVIWAHGQSLADSPTTGDFYRPDEIKYHSVHRGKLTLNFFDVGQPSSSSSGSTVSGSWVYPTSCKTSLNICKYQIMWSLDAATDIITFNIVANQSNAMWTGVGFGPEPKMQNMDVYIGFIDSNNKGVVFDGWVDTQYSRPTRDTTQNVKNANVAYTSGLLTLSFQRPRDTGDAHDWSFKDSGCYYFMFPVGGGQHDDTTISVHQSTPMVSNGKICIGTGGTATTARMTSDVRSQFNACSSVHYVSQHHVISYSVVIMAAAIVRMLQV